MSYWILNKGYRLCGYKGLPFGIRLPRGNTVEFFDREQYEMVLMMDGQTEVNPEKLTEKQHSLFDRFLEGHVICKIDAPEALLPDQCYKLYPAMYKKHIQWSITGACNYRCRHCFMSSPDAPFTEPTWAQCEDAVHQMAECGIKDISLTGGEPLISPHLYKIFDACCSCGIKISSIYTNGRLVTPELLDELEKRRMHPEFQMSFDGIGWHDWLRGVDGAETAVTDAFKLCRDRGFFTSSAFSLHKHNLKGFNESLRLLDSLGVRHCKSNITSPTGFWANETEHFLDPDETFQYLLDTVIPQYFADDLKIGVQFCTLLDWDPTEKDGFIPACKFRGRENSLNTWACGAVYTGGYLSPEGYVLPCMPLIGTAIQEQFDSIYDRPMREILSDSAFTKACMMKMGEVVDAHEECLHCEYKLLCGAGCRACGVGETGTDYKAIDKDICHFFKAGWYEKTKAMMEGLRNH